MKATHNSSDCEQNCTTDSRMPINKVVEFFAVFCRKSRPTPTTAGFPVRAVLKKDPTAQWKLGAVPRRSGKPAAKGRTQKQLPQLRTRKRIRLSRKCPIQ
jgi:hypothetical protein